MEYSAGVCESQCHNDEANWSERCLLDECQGCNLCGHDIAMKHGIPMVANKTNHMEVLERVHQEMFDKDLRDVDPSVRSSIEEHYRESKAASKQLQTSDHVQSRKLQQLRFAGDKEKCDYYLSNSGFRGNTYSGTFTAAQKSCLSAASLLALDELEASRKVSRCRKYPNIRGCKQLHETIKVIKEGRPFYSDRDWQCAGVTNAFATEDYICVKTQRASEYIRNWWIGLLAHEFNHMTTSTAHPKSGKYDKTMFYGECKALGKRTDEDCESVQSGACQVFTKACNGEQRGRFSRVCWKRGFGCQQECQPREWCQWGEGGDADLIMKIVSGTGIYVRIVYDD